jgi:hypothetical protein
VGQRGIDVRQDVESVRGDGEAGQPRHRRREQADRTLKRLGTHRRAGPVNCPNLPQG